MVAKNENGKNVQVPKLVLSNLEEIRRFYDSINRIENKKRAKDIENNFNYKSNEAIDNLKNYNVVISDYLK
jgi:hypothetical protein